MRKIYFLLLLPLAYSGVESSTDTVKSTDVTQVYVSSKTVHGDRKVVEVLKFKSPTTNGQILSPGQKPGSTTLAESEKVAVQASTPTH